MYLKPPNNSSMTFNIRRYTTPTGWTEWYTATIKATSWGNNASGVDWGNVPEKVKNGSNVDWNFSTKTQSIAQNGASYNAGSYADCSSLGLISTVSNNGNNFNCKGNISVEPKFYII